MTSTTGDDDRLVVVLVENLRLLKHVDQTLQQQLVVDADQQVRPRISICLLYTSDAADE